MFKIGEFSVLTQVSIKTHRYDDAVGLLRVDVDSGYRYYSASQVPRVAPHLGFERPRFPLHRMAKVIEEGPRPRCSGAC